MLGTIITTKALNKNMLASIDDFLSKAATFEELEKLMTYIGNYATNVGGLGTANALIMKTIEKRNELITKTTGEVSKESLESLDKVLIPIMEKFSYEEDELVQTEGTVIDLTTPEGVKQYVLDPQYAVSPAATKLLGKVISVTDGAAQIVSLLNIEKDNDFTIKTAATLMKFSSNRTEVMDATKHLSKVRRSLKASFNDDNCIINE
jgi:hypothetical protein